MPKALPHEALCIVCVHEKHTRKYLSRPDQKSMKHKRRNAKNRGRGRGGGGGGGGELRCTGWNGRATGAGGLGEGHGVNTRMMFRRRTGGGLRRIGGGACLLSCMTVV